MNKILFNSLKSYNNGTRSSLRSVHVNMFSEPVWKNFNYRKALKQDGIPLD